MSRILSPRLSVHSFISAFLIISFLSANSPAWSETTTSSSGKADYYLGLDLYHDRDYEGSARAFRAQLEKTPEDASARAWLMKAIEKSGAASLVPHSIASSSPVAQAAPEKTSDDYQRGVALYRDGDYTNAMIAFRNHLDANPRSVPARQWLALLQSHKASVGNSQFGFEQRPVTPPTLPPAIATAQPVPITVPVPVVAPVATQQIPQGEAALREEFLRLRGELELRTQQVARSISQTKRALAQNDLTAKVNADLTTEVEFLRARYDNLKNDITEKEGALNQAQKKLDQAREATPRETTTPPPATGSLELRKAKRELFRAHKKAADLSGETRRLSEEISAMRQERDTIAAQIQQELQQKDTEIANAKAEVSRTLETQRELETKLGELSARWEAKSVENTDLRRAAAEAETRLHETVAGSEQLSEQSVALARMLKASRTGNVHARKKLRDRVLNLNAALEQASISNSQLMQTQQVVQQRWVDSTKQVETLNNQLESLRQTESKLTQDLQEKETHVSDARAETAEARRQLDEALAQAQQIKTELTATQQTIASDDPEIRHALAEAEKTIDQVTRSYQASEDSRVDTERRFLEVSRERDALLRQIASPSPSHDGEASEQKLMNQLAETTKRYEVVRQARSVNKRRIEQMREQMTAMNESIIETERTLGQIAKNLQLSEEKRAAVENQLTLTVSDNQSLATQNNELRVLQKRMMEEAVARQTHLDQISADFAERSSDYESRLGVATTAVSASQRSVIDAMAKLRAAEEARAAAERKLTEALRDRDRAAAEAVELRVAAERLGLEIQDRNSALLSAQENIFKLHQEVEGSRAETAKQATELRRVLEDSRAQGLMLAQSAQNERSQRAQAEQELTGSIEREAQMRIQIEALNDQFRQALPQLQAMHASLDKINIKRQVMEESIPGPDVE